MPESIIDFIEAAKEGRFDDIRTQLDRYPNIHALKDYALGCAARNGHKTTVRLLVERGANIHAFKDSVLRLACIDERWETVDCLLDVLFTPKPAVKSWTAGEDKALRVMNSLKQDADIPPATLTKALEKIEARALAAYNAIRRENALKNPLPPRPPIQPRAL